jgi:2,6-dihydroxypyridine 3-monooxygenase
LLLLQAGFDNVVLYEATPASAPLGGGLIGLEHTALDVLDNLGIAQDDVVKFPSENVLQITMSDRRPVETVRRVYPGRMTSWTLLHATLTARLPTGVLQRGARVVGLAERCGTPNLRFADGREECVDLVVFADGRRSTGRKLLDPGRRLHYAGYVAHRGDAPYSPADLLDFCSFQSQPGTSGPRVQLNIAPIYTESGPAVDWTFYLNCTRPQYTDWFGAPPNRRVFALPQHVSLAARTHVDDSAQEYLPPEQASIVHATVTRMAVPVMDIDPPDQMVWPVGGGHAVLLGDALAPVRPHTARGANAGIEQAAGLVAVLKQHLRHGADLAAALDGWQRHHLPAVIAAIRLGPAIGNRLGLGTT